MHEQVLVFSLKRLLPVLTNPVPHTVPLQNVVITTATRQTEKLCGKKTTGKNWMWHNNCFTLKAKTVQYHTFNNYKSLF